MAEEDGDEIVVRMPDVGTEGPEGYVSMIARVGELVRKDQPIVMLDVGKICVDVVAPEDGVITSFAVADQAEVTIGVPLVTLRRVKIPEPREIRFAWDVTDVERRAAAWPEPRRASAGLFVTALVRAMVAVPALAPAWPIRLVFGDFADKSWWIHATLAPSLTVEEAAALPVFDTAQREGAADVRVTWTRRSSWRWGLHNDPLCVWIEAVADVAGRRRAEVGLVFVSEVASADLEVFAAVLAEQLTVV